MRKIPFCFALFLFFTLSTHGMDFHISDFSDLSFSNEKKISNTHNRLKFSYNVQGELSIISQDRTIRISIGMGEDGIRRDNVGRERFLKGNQILVVRISSSNTLTINNKEEDATSFLFPLRVFSLCKIINHDRHKCMEWIMEENLSPISDFDKDPLPKIEKFIYTLENIFKLNKNDVYNLKKIFYLLKEDDFIGEIDRILSVGEEDKEKELSEEEILDKIEGLHRFIPENVNFNLYFHAANIMMGHIQREHPEEKGMEEYYSFYKILLKNIKENSPFYSRAQFLLAQVELTQPQGANTRQALTHLFSSKEEGSQELIQRLCMSLKNQGKGSGIGERFPFLIKVDIETILHFLEFIGEKEREYESRLKSNKGE